MSNCLESINNTCNSLSVELIIVDNASYDGCIEMCKNYNSKIKTLQLSTNHGFAAANNAAVALATAPLLLFLNPDTILHINAIKELISAFDTIKNLGIAGAKLFNGDGTLQTSCILSYPDIFRQILEFEWLIRKTWKWNFWGVRALYDNSGPVPVEAVSGACLMIKKEDFDSVKGFSNDYFMYAEDIDLCHKVRINGKTIYHIPDSEVTHFGGGSTEATRNSNFSFILMTSASYVFLKKFSGSFKATLFRMAVTISAILRLCIIYIVNMLFKTDNSYSINKWQSLLRWSIGFENWADKAHKKLVMKKK
jgi:GT2 family glycosyltransferase